MPKTILITGASGFIGTHWLEYCKKNVLEYEFVFFQRTEKQASSSNTVGLENLATALLEKNVYAIIHLAGLAHDTKNVSQPEDYVAANTQLTQRLWDIYLTSPTSKFIFVSTIKSIQSVSSIVEDEHFSEKVNTPYALSKRAAEEYLEKTVLPEGKSFYILRPVLVYGNEPKGNLGTLKKWAARGFPYPLAAFDNQRSYLHVDNLAFIIQKILESNIQSGAYNCSDRTPVSTTQWFKAFSRQTNQTPKLWYIPRSWWKALAKMGDTFSLPFNSEILQKMTSDLVVRNHKIVSALGQELPYDTTDFVK